MPNFVFMKLLKSDTHGAFKFIGAGVIIGLTALSNSLIPWQVKISAGVLLVVYGLYLYFKGDTEGNPSWVSRWVVVATVILLFVGGMFYYFFPAKPEKEFMGLQGSFEMELSGKEYEGTARVEGEKLMLQFEVSPGLQVKSISLADIPALQKAGLSWICAANRYFQIVACSSDLASSKGFSDQFFDEGLFTIMFQFKEPLALKDLNSVSFSIVTNLGNANVVVHQDEK